VARRASALPDVSKPLGDRIEFLKISQLRLDPKNPRLPKGLRSQGQEAILKFIAENYEPIIVGRSIALHRYFISEPLIVLKARSDTYTVVEGNRRLVALKLLSEKKSRDLVDDPEWEELSRRADLPRRGIPAVIATSREEIAPIIGYRHIAGIQEWDPFPKARYITQFIDGPDKLSFAQVAELVGEVRLGSGSGARRLAPGVRYRRRRRPHPPRAPGFGDRGAPRRARADRRGSRRRTRLANAAARPARTR
jgi:ParB-like nuclease domain